MNIKRKTRSWRARWVVPLMLVTVATPAWAQDGTTSAWSLELTYKADLFGVVRGGAERGVRGLDNLDIAADADLEALLGWTGANAHLSLLNNMGGRPNDVAGTLQGIDNIEVSNARFKVYEAWVEQGVFDGALTLKAGLYDLNSEFYANEAAGLLLAPPFGIGSELSATGPNGPSIFPSTALAVRFDAHLWDFYLRGALVNAQAGTIGDDHGVDFSAREGVLMIAEAGTEAHGKLALGVWTYTKHQPVITPPDVTLTEDTAEAVGGYIVVEQPLFEAQGEGASGYAFLRAGISEGKTTPFRGGWQVGLLIERPFPGRPASALSFGIGSAILTSDYRLAADPALPPLKRSETVFELTYSDEIMPGVSLQPDVQYIANPAADPALEDAIVFGLRLTVSFAAP